MTWKEGQGPKWLELWTKVWTTVLKWRSSFITNTMTVHSMRAITQHLPQRQLLSGSNSICCMHLLANSQGFLLKDNNSSIAHMTKVILISTSHPPYLLWWTDHAQQESSTTRINPKKESVRKTWVKTCYIQVRWYTSPIFYCILQYMHTRMHHLTAVIINAWDFRNRLYLCYNINSYLQYSI